MPPTVSAKPLSALSRKILEVRQWALRLELRVAPTESQRLFALTLVIGLACGFAAVAFHFSIRFAESMLFERAIVAPGRYGLVWGVATPVLGGLAAGILLQYVVPNARGSGVPQVKVAYASRDGIVRLRDSIGKLFIASLQIGSGASLGREGPTVQICCGIASALGRFGRLSPRNQRRLLPVGAAAGIAAAFNALLRTALPPGQRVFPVLSVEGKMLGLVTSDELSVLEAEPSLAPLVTASDIMRPAVCVRLTDSLLTALDMMRAERLPELPVVDESGRILGFVDEATIASAYLHESDPKSQPGGAGR